MFDIGNIDPMGLVIFTLPVLTLIISIILQLIFKKRLVIVVANFFFWLILTFTVFNSSFLIWVIVYTIIALIGTFIADLILTW